MDGLIKTFNAFIGLVALIIRFFFLIIIMIIIGFFVFISKCDLNFPGEAQRLVRKNKGETMIIKSQPNIRHEQSDMRSGPDARQPMERDEPSTRERIYYTDRFDRVYYLKNHLLESDQDFFDVCQMYHVNPREVLFLNGLHNGAGVREGDAIKVPIYVSNR